VSEHVVPERLAQLAHRFTLARERAQDEVERAPQLEKKRQVPPGSFLAEVAPHQVADHLVRERYR
jgi:hypothetical protein